MDLKDLVNFFQENTEFLERAGWIVSEVESPKWWGGLNSYEEIAISAILVQLSTWTSVEKALERLREKRLSSLKELANLDVGKLEELTKPVGLRRIKARRLIGLARNLMKVGGLEELKRIENVRDFLMSIEGVGKETADSIMLFALNKPTIPISNYVKIVLERVGIIKSKKSYETSREEFLEQLGDNLYNLKLFYAGITSIGRVVCKNKPKCNACPLKDVCTFNKLYVR